MQQKNKNRNTIIQLAVGIIISVVFIYFTFRKLDLGKILESIRAVNLFYVMLAVVINTGILVLRGIRWRELIPTQKHIHTGTLISATYIGYMANNIFPAKVGEIVRPYMLGAKEGISKTSAFASVVMERLIDGLSAFIILIILTFTFPDLNENMRRAFPAMHIDLRQFAVAIFVLFAAMFTFLMFLRFGREQALSIVRFFLKPFPKVLGEKVIQVIHKFTDGIGFAYYPRSIIITVIYTLVYWAALGFGLMFLLFAFPFSASLPAPYLTALWVLCISGLGFSIPSAPSNIGTFEFACVFALVLSGVNANDAASYALVSHAVSAIPQIIVGFICLLTSGIHLKDAAAASKE
ncbi:MAG: flippase-like domain-containing protein [Spirochaetes bacterium]|nr:flippase-like domain-containing protein [Spirochaetota bacterium]